jgi:hypothetical protein
MKTMKPFPMPIICREIEPADFESLSELLSSGYDSTNCAFWMGRFKRLTMHTPPPGYPKFGFVLERGGAPVGVIISIYSAITISNVRKIRCYFTNWYVKAEFRSYASMMVSRARKYTGVTYMIGTPSERVRPILEAQGYSQYCAGRFAAVPLLSRQKSLGRVQLFNGKDGETVPEEEILAAHARYGCLSVTCAAQNGVHPFIFQPALKAGLLPFARLIYCREVSEFVQFAAILGRFLISRGYPVVVLDADGPVPGLVGRYSTNFPKFFVGPDRPRLGDAAYSERVIFKS